MIKPENFQRTAIQSSPGITLIIGFTDVRE
jgi:hypothetical protein